MLRSIWTIGIVLLLAACGGGGGSSRPVGTTMPEVIVPEVLWPEVTITTSRVQDSADRATITQYLQDAIDGSVIRHLNAPTLRFAASTDAIRRQYTQRAVEIINSALPPQYRLRIGTDAPDHSPDVPNGEIFVDFVPDRDYPGPSGSRAVARRVLFDNNPMNLLFSTHIWVDTDNFENRIAHNLSRDNMTRVMLHEILHAMGMTSHVDGLKSIMNERVNITREFLYPIDRDGLAGLYLLNIGDTPDDLGPWSDTSMNIRGELGDASFGVRSNNGVSTPWIDGPEPGTNLAGPAGIGGLPDLARHISGTVTWRGALVGFTPSVEAVTGDADLEVDLGPTRRRPDARSSFRLAGNLHFDNIVYHETGVPWIFGTLDYGVTVSQNTFVGTGGNEGAVAGAFFGSQHEWMAGTLDRSDLIATFGGER